MGHYNLLLAFVTFFAFVRHPWLHGKKMFVHHNIIIILYVPNFS